MTLLTSFTLQFVVTVNLPTLPIERSSTPHEEARYIFVEGESAKDVFSYLPAKVIVYFRRNVYTNDSKLITDKSDMFSVKLRGFDKLSYKHEKSLLEN